MLIDISGYMLCLTMAILLTALAAFVPNEGYHSQKYSQDADSEPNRKIYLC